MHKRTAHRWRLSIIMLIGVVLSAGSFWMVQVITNSDNEIAASARLNEPDYIVENFSFVRMNKVGKPSYIISGTKLTHVPLDDIAMIEHPVVQSLAADQPPMTMQSKQARIDHNNREVHLLGGVDVTRTASPKAEALSLTTEALTILPDDEQMQTDQPLTLKVGRSTLTGVGMQANNATGDMRILDKVHLSIPARVRAAPRKKISE